ncbi:hypothetical protein [Marinifaba aquimaris]|uniref:hypothetical protein n=1 Tax=Marinifaba aquimaris TaxID=2741323 RepID=UPI001FE5A21C|nr:hypothetical protein [Marinifaba aquimaris]
MDEHLKLEEKEFTSRMINVAIKIAALFIMVSICFDILKPFLMPISWGMILAVALYPISEKLTLVLSGRRTLAATIITLVGIAILVVPTVKFSSSAVICRF